MSSRGGSSHLSPRMQHLVEAIKELKNNKAAKHAAVRHDSPP